MMRDADAILNRMIREGTIGSFETNFSDAASLAFGLNIRVLADLGVAPRTRAFDERRRELRDRIMRQLEPMAPGAIVSVRGTPAKAAPEAAAPAKTGRITGEQCRAARRLLGWSLEKYAHRAGVSLGAIGAFERGESMPRPETLEAIIGTLKAAGVEFIEDAPGVKIRKANEP